MLPFLKRTQDGAASTPIETLRREPDNEADYDGLEAAAQDVLDAMESKNVKHLAAALRAAFELCDEEPHVEGPHEKE